MGFEIDNNAKLQALMAKYKSPEGQQNVKDLNNLIFGGGSIRSGAVDNSGVSCWIKPE